MDVEGVRAWWERLLECVEGSSCAPRELQCVKSREVFSHPLPPSCSHFFPFFTRMFPRKSILQSILQKTSRRSFTSTPTPLSPNPSSSSRQLFLFAKEHSALFLALGSLSAALISFGAYYNEVTVSVCIPNWAGGRRDTRSRC